MGWPPTITTRSDQGRVQSSHQSRAPTRTRSAGPPTQILPGVAKPIAADGRRAEQVGPIRGRVIEMQDAGRLAKHLEEIEIAIGVERIAGVVGGDHHGHAGRGQLVQRRDAAPARRAAGLAVLQVHVDERQRDDRDAGLADERR